jgi:glyoxylate carboligase
MKASDLFVRCLETEGIEYIFGVPGEENADFMMSLEHSSNRIGSGSFSAGTSRVLPLWPKFTDG